MNPQVLNYITIATVVASGILAYGDQIQNVPGIPGWLAHSWGFVFMLAGIIKAVGSALSHQQTQANTAAIAAITPPVNVPLIPSSAANPLPKQ
jgi:hypothetical protein